MDGSGPRRVHEDAITHEADVALWRGEPFTGVVWGDDVGHVDEMTYRHGVLHGPQRTWSPTGVLVEETWWEASFVHGVERFWRPDGTLERARARDHGVVVWDVTFAADGGTIANAWEVAPDSVEQQAIEEARRSRPMRAIPPIESAADLNVH